MACYNFVNRTDCKKGFSYRKLAEKANCSQTQISLILKGERNPSPENAINICKALECKFDDIFFINLDDKSNQIMQSNTQKGR